jgi:hypothetical protein
LTSGWPQHTTFSDIEHHHHHHHHHQHQQKQETTAAASSGSSTSQSKQKSSLSACGTNSRHIQELQLTAGEAAMTHEAAAAAL